MNVQAQLCGIILLMMLLLLSFSRRSVWLRTRKAFIFTLSATLVSLACDMASIFAITTADGNYDFNVRVISKAYLITLVITTFSAFLYISMDIDVNKKNRRIKRITNLMVALLACIAIIISPIEFVCKNDYMVYTEGLAVSVAYATCSFFIVLNLLVLLTHRDEMSVRRWNASVIWMFIWIVAALIQARFNYILIVGYGSALGALMVFIRLENPESYVDRTTGYFNNLALFAYMDQAYDIEKRFMLISIRIVNNHYLYERFNSHALHDFIRNVSDALGKQKKCHLYKSREWEFTLVFENLNNFENVIDYVEEITNRNWLIDGEYVRIEMSLTKVPDSSIASDSEEMDEMLRIFNKEHETDTKRIYTLDRAWADEYRKSRASENMIVDALDNSRLEVFFQPIYSIEKERFVSAEALVRIRDEEGKIVPPSVFIDVAERTGQIIQVGAIVFEKVCRFIVNNNLDEKGIEYIEVNVSGVQASRYEMADEYIEIMEKVGVEPEKINLEITESAAINSRDALMHNLNKLNDYGVSFSLDDYGTGYSNLNYILDFPITIVKLDRSMTQAYFADYKRRIIMKHTVDMIKKIALEIVAEGVDEKVQFDELKEIGVDFIQGYYFSKPIPAEDFIKLINHKNEEAREIEEEKAIEEAKALKAAEEAKAMAPAKQYDVD